MLLLSDMVVGVSLYPLKKLEIQGKKKVYITLHHS